MKNKLKSLIENENKFNPLTDSKLAKALNTNRENVTKIRRELKILDSRQRKRPYLIRSMESILSKNPNISERDLTDRLKNIGFQVSRHSIREIKKEVKDHVEVKPKKKKKPVDEFQCLIGYEGSLKPYIQQAKAAMLYPPHGLHTLILGPTGVGKSELADGMFRFAKKSRMICKDANMVIFNCADYADNPQLLMSQLFGYVKGAFTGALSDKEGLVERADGSILFLDEVHRLPPEGQELLFHLIDRGKFRRLGETNYMRKAQITIIAATTENADSILLSTFRRRIPMVIELPNLQNRPMNERFRIIRTFFRKEADRINNTIKINNNVLRAFLLYNCLGNVGQLRSDIQVSCAKGFLNFVTNDLKILQITVDDIPAYTKKGLLKNKNYRSDMEKIIGIEDFIAYPSQEKRELKSYDDNYIMPSEIYGYIEKRYEELKNKFKDQDVINYIIGNEMEKEVNKLFNKFDSDIKPIEKKDLISIVGIEIVDVVEKILKIAEKNLMISIDYLYYVLAIHLNSTIERIKEGKETKNPRLKNIKDKYLKEYMVAQTMVHVINTDLGVNLSEDEVGFIAMYLGTVTKKDENIYEGRVGVLVATHGDVSYAMVDVANRLLGVNFAKAVNMSLDESPECALIRTTEMVKKMDEGKGVLILVDMGSLVTFGEIVTKKTNIKTRSISRVDTVMLMEAIRKAMLPESNLDEIADSLEEAPKYVCRLTKEINPSKGKKKALLAMCITGEGAALKIKELLANITYKYDLKIITIGAIEEHMDITIEEIRKKYDLVGIVGTINPNIDNIEYISLEEIINKKGIKRLEILMEENKSISSQSLIDEKLVFHNLHVESKEELIDILGEALIENKYVKKDYIKTIYDRENMGATYFTNSSAIPHGDPQYVKKPVICVASLKNPIKWGDDLVKIVFLLCLKAGNIDGIINLQRLCEDEDNIKSILQSDKEHMINLLKSNL